MTTTPSSSRKLRTCLPNHFLRPACLLLATFLLAGCLRAVPLPVRIDARDGMSRGGNPYFVKGAGGSENLDPLAARGANSIRTWTTSGLAEILDQSEALKLTVSAGIWLEEECAWFSYQNPEHCAKQAKRVRKEVLLYRAHPALLAWGIGNEVEGDGTNTAFWQQLDRLSRMVKSLDPAHPTFTAVAGMNQAKADGMNRYAPSLDFVGVNTYGAVFGLRERLEKIGWKRPWLLTEWGPRGFWESPKIQSGAPLEQTSTEKAAMMRKAYQAVISPDGGCLGSYAFVWGWKFEATATWFGIMTHDGQTTAVADALQEVWGGGKPANQAPAVEALRGVPTSSLPVGGSFDASCRATDPDGDTLVWQWAVLPEQKKHHSANPKKMPSPVSCMITKKSSDSVGVTAPDKPGVYRLHVWIKDGKGHAATANAPFEVR